ncbi:MAG: DUF3267 domain-containing protein [Lachnospiraceae bacterium]|nr:DUF3267 domain-containing protein [Lachnospiraceae bacterium]
MNKFFEKELPEGYVEAFVVDAYDKESSKGMRIGALVTAVVTFNMILFLYAIPRWSEIIAGFSIIGCLELVATYVLYISMHELTHGAVYKLLTKQRILLGFNPPAAYCGVPDIYVYRLTSLISLFAPFTIFGILFLAMTILTADPFAKLLIMILLALHVIGCVGDLYGAWILLFKLKDPATLRKDTGPKQIYYTKG